MLISYEQLILLIIVIDFVFEQIIDFKNASWFSKPIPKILADIYNVEKYKQQQNYKFENYRLGIISSVCSFILIFTVLILNGFSFVDNIVSQITDNQIFRTLLFFGICFSISGIVQLPFSIYDTFVIEKKYGFNTTTSKIFITDLIKSLLITIIIGGGILSLIVYIYLLTPTYFWLLAWVLITIFSLFMLVFYSNLIVPLFNKQTALEDGELKNAIMDFAQKTGFKISNIFVIDGSKRSTKANAYFTGFGKQKRIVLYDTLIKEMMVPEIVAVLAHEIGHYKYKHIIGAFVIGIIETGIMLFIFSFFASSDELSQALGVEKANFYIALIAFSLIYSPIASILGIFSNILSRKNEIQADNFAKKYGLAKDLISALKKLSSHNFTNLTPHTWNVFFNYSHPTIYDRITKLSDEK